MENKVQRIQFHNMIVKTHLDGDASQEWCGVKSSFSSAGLRVGILKETSHSNQVFQ